MAKYDVLFSCGHVETVTLYGKETERQRKIEWFERECKCTKCQEAESNALRAQRTEKLAAKGFEFRFNGTEKQIAFAEDIIGRALESILTNANESESECRSVCARFFMAIVAGALKVNLSSAKSVIESKDAIEAKATILVDGVKKMITQNGVAETIRQFNEQITKAEAMIQPRSECPEIIKDKRWNGKIYGKKGGYNVYLNGEKTMISDEQTAELENYSKSTEVTK